MPVKTEDCVEKQSNGIVNDRFTLLPSQQNGIIQKTTEKIENGKIATQNGDLDEDDDEELPTADVVVPLDGGFGWVVVAASFLCCVIVGMLVGAI